MTTASLDTRPRSGRAWLALALSSRTAALPTDCALAAARVALAWIFIYYGAAKLFGSFGGASPLGLHQTSLFFSNVAHLHPGGLFAVLSGVIEFGGGIALALGFASRLAGIALFGDMVIAMITVTWTTGINPVHAPPGYQLNIALGVLALVVAILGAGRFSLDSLIERHLMRTVPSQGDQARSSGTLETASPARTS
ncbi:MAG TPA: DoxX family protein [Acidimicrobiales bacterium]|nr:DoxX family protein [Acidimicrobiales bacterium]